MQDASFPITQNLISTQTRTSDIILARLVRKAFCRDGLANFTQVLHFSASFTQLYKIICFCLLLLTTPTVFQ